MAKNNLTMERVKKCCNREYINQILERLEIIIKQCNPMEQVFTIQYILNNRNRLYQDATQSLLSKKQVNPPDLL